MKRSVIHRVVLSFLLAIGVVVGLIMLSGILKSQQGAFLRIFPSHPIVPEDTLNLNYDSYYVAGTSAKYVYLGNYAAPLHVLKVNLNNLSDTTHIRLRVDSIEWFRFLSPKVIIDPPAFYLVDGSAAVFFRGSTENWTARQWPWRKIFFRDIILGSSNEFLLKSLSGRTGENILGRADLSGNFVFREDILEKQIDGVFCTDGKLISDRNGHYIYMYYYRNEYVLFDSLLRTHTNRQTIDTTRIARIAVRRIDDGHTAILSSPPRFVNIRGWADDNVLYIQSGTLARNEHREVLDFASPFDVYEISTGNYLYSFYLPHFNGVDHLSDFAVFNGYLIAILGKTAQSFRISTPAQLSRMRFEGKKSADQVGGQHLHRSGRVY